MSKPNLAFPSAVASDPEAVTSALESGGAEWKSGDLREAVRWIHRAADAAEAAGDDRRALGLARVAADMMSTLELSAAPPPRDEASALTPFDDFNDQTIVDSPAILAARAAQPGTVVIEERRVARGSSSSSALVRQDGLSATPRARTALRVAVARADDAERLLIVRVLEEGAAPPPGAAEAFLLWLDPDAALPTEIRRA